MNLRSILSRKFAVPTWCCLLLLWGGQSGLAEEKGLRVAVFRVDATPRVGSPVAFALARKIEDPLSARGIVLLGAGQPIVLCAVDWVAICNSGHDLWREKLAEAAGTTVERVAVHVLHQHDGLFCDLTTEELLAGQGQGGKKGDPAFIRQVISDTAAGVKAALAKAQPVTHLGVGAGQVEKVASNRRILGPDGKVKLFRMSSWRIRPEVVKPLKELSKRDGYQMSPFAVEEAREAPEGVIDPVLRMVSLWNGARPVVCLSYYATHPQSYFGQGDVTAEFVGLARAEREQALKDLPLIHFNGAGGNIAAGKYNDGTPETRVLLTRRMAEGMRKAWEATEKTPLSAADVAWNVRGVLLPPHPRHDMALLKKSLVDPKIDEYTRFLDAFKLAYVTRHARGQKIELARLRLKQVDILHMPGELFVEYQLAAQKMKPEGTVCMAAYGDCGPGYIGTAIAYAQGGYEVTPGYSNVGPGAEEVLMEGMRELLGAKKEN